MKIKDPTANWARPTHWKNFDNKRIQEWLDSLEMLLRDLNWAYIPNSEFLNAKSKNFKRKRDVEKSEAKIKGFLLSALAIGFIDPEELRHIKTIVGMIELRDPINVCLGMLRMEFKEVKP